MKKNGQLSQSVVDKRKRKEQKRKQKIAKRGKTPEFKGMLTAGGFVNKDKWAGMKPRKLEGFVLYLRGVKITKDNWPLTNIAYGTRLRFQ